MLPLSPLFSSGSARKSELARNLIHAKNRLFHDVRKRAKRKKKPARKLVPLR